MNSVDSVGKKKNKLTQNSQKRRTETSVNSVSSVGRNKLKNTIMTENDLTYRIRGSIFKVYKQLGPGLLESVYEEALVYQLSKDGMQVARQTSIPIYYDGIKLSTNLRLDIIVEDSVIIEIKSVKEIETVHHKQLLTYMKLARKHLGFLVNFNTDDINRSTYRKILG